LSSANKSKIKFENNLQVGNMSKKIKIKLKQSVSGENILERLRKYVARSRRMQNKRIQNAIAHAKK
jgi:hypothetical protein